MPKLAPEHMRMIKRYHELRFSHKPPTWTAARKRQVIKKLKNAPEDIRAKHMAEIREFLRINGDNNK